LNAHTRNPSEGSVPAIAPARAAVKDSTSSTEMRREQATMAMQEEQTNQHDNKRVFFLYHVCDTTEQALHEFTRFREPTREQRM